MRLCYGIVKIHTLLTFCFEVAIQKKNYPYAKCTFLYFYNCILLSCTVMNIIAVFLYIHAAEKIPI